HDFAAVGTLLAGTKPAADLAILNSYDDRWAIHTHEHHKDFNYREHLLHYYRPLAGGNVTTDIISTDASLDGYKLVIAPTLHLLNEERVARLLEFVERGGHLVLTVRSGLKDDLNALLPSRPPGPLTEAAGVEVEDYYALIDTVPVSGALFTGTSSIWAERLRVRDEVDTEIIARFGPSNGWLDHQPAITAHAWGSGKVYVIGAWLDDDSQHALLARIVKEAGVEPVMQTSSGVEARKRVDGQGKEVYIVVNHERTEQILGLPWPAHNHLTDREEVEDMLLAPYGVAVLTRS
ncbi:MAG TPA: DUF4350 domain-containing protein, partial [Thermomicrobiales bacterium]|nr:DUF4350 domain-containing protein [Thermomicrobiales bacterium]